MLLFQLLSALGFFFFVWIKDVTLFCVIYLIVLSLKGNGDNTDHILRSSYLWWFSFVTLVGLIDSLLVLIHVVRVCEMLALDPWCYFYKLRYLSELLLLRDWRYSSMLRSSLTVLFTCSLSSLFPSDQVFCSLGRLGIVNNRYVCYSINKRVNISNLHG